MNSRRYLFLVFLIVGYAQGICQTVDMAAVKRESCASLEDDLVRFERGDSYGFFSVIGGRHRDLQADLQLCGKDIPEQWRANMTRRLVDLFASLDDEDGITTVARKRNIVEVVGGYGLGDQAEDFYLKLFDYPNSNYRDTFLRRLSPYGIHGEAFYKKLKEKQSEWKIEKTLFLYYLRRADPELALPEIQRAVGETTSHEEYYHLAGLLCRGYRPEDITPLIDKYSEMLYVQARDAKSVREFRHPASGIYDCENTLIDYALAATGERRKTAIEILKRQNIIKADIKRRLSDLFPEDFPPVGPKRTITKPEVKQGPDQVLEIVRPLYYVGRDRKFNLEYMLGYSTAVVKCGEKVVFEKFFSPPTTSLHLTPKGLPYGHCTFMAYSRGEWTTVNFYNIELEARISEKSVKSEYISGQNAYRISFDVRFKPGEGISRVELIGDGTLIWSKSVGPKITKLPVETILKETDLPRNYLLQIINKRGLYVQRPFTISAGSGKGDIKLQQSPQVAARLVPKGKNVSVSLGYGVTAVFDEVYEPGELKLKFLTQNPYYPPPGESLQEQEAYDFAAGALSFSTVKITFWYDRSKLSTEQEEKQAISRLIPISAGGPLERYPTALNKTEGTVSVTVKKLGKFIRTIPAYKRTYIAKSSKLVNGLPELEVRSGQKISIVESPKVKGSDLAFNDTLLLSAFYAFEPKGLVLDPQAEIIMRYDPAKIAGGVERCPPSVKFYSGGGGASYRTRHGNKIPNEFREGLYSTSEIVALTCSQQYEPERGQ